MSIDDEQTIKSKLTPNSYPQFWFGDRVTFCSVGVSGVVYGVELKTPSTSDKKDSGWWYKVLWDDWSGEALQTHEDNLKRAE